MAEPNWKEFCSKILNIAHEGDIDSDQVYNIGVETGCVQIVECTVPCVPDDHDMIQCGCAEYCDRGEVVDCHRLADPNTRALDERVKELRDWVNSDEAGMHKFACSIGRMRHFARAVLDAKLNELFPAELKDKLKESEDGN